MNTIQLFTLLLISASSLAECMPAAAGSADSATSETDHTGLKWNWLSGILATGRFTFQMSSLVNPNGTASNTVLESLCNMSKYANLLEAVNTTQAHNLLLVLEKVMFEGCRLLNVNDSVPYTETAECTHEDIKLIQTVCISKDLLVTLLAANGNATMDHAENVSMVNDCAWLQNRVPQSESIQATLGCM